MVANFVSLTSSNTHIYQYHNHYFEFKSIILLVLINLSIMSSGTKNLQNIFVHWMFVLSFFVLIGFGNVDLVMAFGSDVICCTYDEKGIL